MKYFILPLAVKAHREMTPGRQYIPFPFDLPPFITKIICWHCMSKLIAYQFHDIDEIVIKDENVWVGLFY